MGTYDWIRFTGIIFIFFCCRNFCQRFQGMGLQGFYQPGFQGMGVVVNKSFKDTPRKFFPANLPLKNGMFGRRSLRFLLGWWISKGKQFSFQGLAGKDGLYEDVLQLLPLFHIPESSQCIWRIDLYDKTPRKSRLAASAFFWRVIFTPAKYDPKIYGVRQTKTS